MTRRPITLLLALGALVLTCISSCSSCKKDPPKPPVEITDPKTYEEAIKAIEDGTLKDEEAAHKLIELINKMRAGEHEKFIKIAEVLVNAKYQMKTKLYLIEAAIRSELVLVKKFDLLEVVVKDLTSTPKEKLALLEKATPLLSTQVKNHHFLSSEGKRLVMRLITAIDAQLDKLRDKGTPAEVAFTEILKRLSEIKRLLENDPMEYVDLGLSVKWSTRYLGAVNPEDYGDYYAWGETEPRTNSFEMSTYKLAKPQVNDPLNYGFTKYCFSSWLSFDGSIDNKDVLDPEDDAARAKLGAPFRIPTNEEIWELIDNCIWMEETINGIVCLRATSKINHKSIILSKNGRLERTKLMLRGAASIFWTNRLSEFTDTGSKTRYVPVFFYDKPKPLMHSDLRFIGLNVRAVHP